MMICKEYNVLCLMTPCVFKIETHADTTPCAFMTDAQ